MPLIGSSWHRSTGRTRQRANTASGYPLVHRGLLHHHRASAGAHKRCGDPQRQKVESENDASSWERLRRPPDGRSGQLQSLLNSDRSARQRQTPVVHAFTPTCSGHARSHSSPHLPDRTAISR
jgi:hypothetical protein